MSEILSSEVSEIVKAYGPRFGCYSNPVDSCLKGWRYRYGKMPCVECIVKFYKKVG